MLGNIDSPEWLSTDAIRAYIVLVKDGVSKTIWDELQYQVFLGDNDFVENYQTMLVKLSGDLLKIPLNSAVLPSYS